MKPILVNNNQEWIRLAPVLEKQAHTWGENCTPLQYNPFTPNKTYYSGGAIVISFGWGILSWRHFSENSGETQLVNEYLLSLENPLIDYDSFEDKAARVAIDNLKKHDLSINAKSETVDYEAQTRAIEETLNEISIKGQIARSIYRETKDEALCYTMQGAETAYLKCFEILTNKLK